MNSQSESVRSLAVPASSSLGRKGSVLIIGDLPGQPSGNLDLKIAQLMGGGNHDDRKIESPALLEFRQGFRLGAPPATPSARPRSRRAPDHIKRGVRAGGDARRAARTRRSP